MSEYDELLNQLTDRLLTAGKLIPKMCDALKGEHLSKDDINDKVTKDCLAAGLGRSTIMHNMPDEFKDPERVEAAKKAQHKKQEIIVTNDGSVASDSAALHEPEQRSQPIVYGDQPYTPPQEQVTVKKDWIKIIRILKEDFTFDKDPEIWKDKAEELGKELLKPEYRGRVYRILIEEVTDN